MTGRERGEGRKEGFLSHMLESTIIVDSLPAGEMVILFKKNEIIILVKIVAFKLLFPVIHSNCR